MARGPFDKRGAEKLFERHELAADRSQGLAQLTACGRQIPRIRNPDEHPHRGKLVHNGLSRKTERCLAKSLGTHQNRETPHADNAGSASCAQTSLPTTRPSRFDYMN